MLSFEPTIQALNIYNVVKDPLVEPIISTIRLEPASIETFARWKQSLGHHVIYKNGTYWEKVFNGFYQPLHFLQKLEPEQIINPDRLSWGVRGALPDKYAGLANSYLSIYALEDFKTFDISRYSRKRRENLRRCLRKLDFREVRDEKVLYDQGYDVVKSSLERTQHKSLISKEDYLKKCTAYVNNGDNSRLVLGAFLDDRLAAYSELCAVDDTVYLMNMVIASDALKFGASSGLSYIQFLLSRNSEKITEMFAGGYTPNDLSLDRFKKGTGLSIRTVPFLNKVIKPVMLTRYFYPRVYRKIFAEKKC